MHRHKATCRLWFVGAMLISGCTPHTEIVLLQPEPDGASRELHVASQWAAFAAGDGADHLLLGWPWPGAHGGRHVFELFLRVPQAEGTYAARASAGEDPVVTGLLYQHTGRAAGRTCLLDGTITVSGGENGMATWREGTFDLACRDGTRLTGTFRAKRSRLTLMRFEDRHAADIRSAFERTDGTNRLGSPPPHREADPAPAGRTVAGGTPSTAPP